MYNCMCDAVLACSAPQLGSLNCEAPLQNQKPRQPHGSGQGLRGFAAAASLSGMTSRPTPQIITPLPPLPLPPKSSCPSSDRVCTTPHEGRDLMCPAQRPAPSRCSERPKELSRTQEMLKCCPAPRTDPPPHAPSPGARGKEPHLPRLTVTLR